MAKFPCSLTSILLVVIAIHISSNTVSMTSDGELLIDPRTMFKYQMPETCIGQSYCFEKGDHYPDDIMQKLNLNFEIQNSIGTRKGSDVDEPDCPSNSTDSPIYYIVDKNDIVRVVVQIPDKFPQRFNVRWCLNEGKIKSDTKHFMASTTLKKYDVECVSSKLEFDFIVLSLESDDKIEIATTNLPVCCKCRYELKKN